MKRNTIKWRIFKSNLLVIIVLITLTTVIFNVAVRVYIERDILSQLNKIASNAEDTALRQGPDFFPEHIKFPPPDANGAELDKNRPLHDENNDLYRFYFMLGRSLKEPLSVLNADFILLDSSKNIINPFSEEYLNNSARFSNQITNEIDKLKDSSKESYLNLRISGTEYIVIIKPVSKKNSFGLGWIVIYSSIEKVNQLRLVINLILAVILLLSALIILLFSSHAAKKITAPFSPLNHHIRAIAERNFGTKINTSVYDELSELVSNINIMSEKLETYDKAQKTFLQNASHEFRTPLMSIQSYAEGIKYDVVDKITASDIIIDETKRMTNLVEDLLYLSRLDAIEESYRFDNLDFDELIKSCVERMSIIASKNNKEIIYSGPNEKIEICADDEKLSRALTNIISNCIRYAESVISINSRLISNNKIELSISDDGPGFGPDELPNVFERFFKGKKGKFGLGLAISKNVIEKHHGVITAQNSESGALFKILLPLKHT